LARKTLYLIISLFFHIRIMRECAFLLLCFCCKTRIDTEKYLELLKMAKWGTRSPGKKMASMPFFYLEVFTS